MENIQPEKRIGERFDLVFPVRLKSNDVENIDLFTRDISSKGAYIRTSKPLEKGTRVELSVSFPTGEIYLNVRGKVVRVEQGGMAIQFNNSAKFVDSQVSH